MTIMTQTLQLAYRIAIVWSGGFLLAVTVRALLPDEMGLTFNVRQTGLFVPFDRLRACYSLSRGRGKVNNRL